MLEGSTPFDDPVIPQGSVDIRAQLPPPTPVLKDLDSFSEGTGHGSFDYSMASGQGLVDQRPASLAYSPAHPEESVIMWRNDVHRCTAEDTALELEREGPSEQSEVGCILLFM